jgi:hypothetical protein
LVFKETPSGIENETLNITMLTISDNPKKIDPENVAQGYDFHPEISDPKHFQLSVAVPFRCDISYQT